MKVYIAPVDTPDPMMSDPSEDPRWSDIVDSDLPDDARRALVVVEEGRPYYKPDVRIEPDGTGHGWRIHMIPVIDPAIFREIYGEDPR